MLRAGDTKMIETLFVLSGNGKTHKSTVTMQCNSIVCVFVHII